MLTNKTFIPGVLYKTKNDSIFFTYKPFSQTEKDGLIPIKRGTIMLFLNSNIKHDGVIQLSYFYFLYGERIIYDTIYDTVYKDHNHFYVDFYRVP